MAPPPERASVWHWRRSRTRPAPARSGRRNRGTSGRPGNCLRSRKKVFQSSPSNEQPTARDAVDGQEVFQVTHPFHPLFGREFVLIERRNAWGEERVYFHDDSGRVRRLTAAWTNAVAPDPFERVSAGRSHFRVDHLLHLVALIARQNEAKGALRARPRSRKVSSK
ncbi:DUF5372 family protein [Candidatus Accumulibacter sp. ACC003]|uniref:DUF5372 family protein n=1 Tax=Candidatus Accumulibacter sp. ACC003 TaxID=2823334 RepID=UPI0025C17996|nr:DUF5372 family protein [Candidatus Accumulibacter sp. ACC003]